MKKNVGTKLWGGLFVAVTLLFSVYWLTHRPSPVRKPPRERAVGVRILVARRGDYTVRVKSVGQVYPVRTSLLSMRVGGTVKEVSRSLVAGGVFRKGEMMLRLDGEDYELALKRAESSFEEAKAGVVQAERNVEIAEVNLLVARSEASVASYAYELYGDEVPSEFLDLVTRKTSVRLARARLEAARGALKAARARLRSAEIAVDNARLSLERTELRAPFDCVVSSVMVDRGSTVGTGQAVAKVFAVDEFRVYAEMAWPDVRMLHVPGVDCGEGEGSEVIVFAGGVDGDGGTRRGRVVGLLADVDAASRLPRVVAAVRDPLDLKKRAGKRHPVLVGQRVVVVFKGRRLSRVFVLPRRCLREGEFVWVADESSRLRIRKVDVAWKDSSVVVVSGGLKEGERVVCSDIAAPVDGLLLQVEDADGGRGSKEKR